MMNKFLKSGVSGTISTSIYILSSYILDKYINNKTSNLIGLLLGAIVNYILQHKIFLNSISSTPSILFRFIISEIIIIFSTEMSVNTILDDKKKYIKYLPDELNSYYNTIIRIIVACMVFILVSYPIRSSWVFII